MHILILDKQRISRFYCQRKIGYKFIGAKKNNGFTLMELSLVLVIIGLLIGGILTGKHLIDSAEMRTIPSDIMAFEMAIGQFEQKYKCKPGDCLAAASHGLGASGDGNGWLGWSGTLANNQEYLRAWQHLANAELIPGGYTGEPAGDSYADAVPVRNVPATKFDYEIGYSFFPVLSNNMTRGHPNYGLPWYRGYEMIWLGEVVDNSFTRGRAFLVDRVKAMDEKFDDGKANDGFIRQHIGFSVYSDDCTTPEYTNGTVSVFDYDLSKGADCSIVFLVEW